MKKAAEQDSPWRYPVAVAHIPEAGLHHHLMANAEQLERLAATAGVIAISNASADLDLANAAGERVHVTGLVKGRVVQTCVVTLDPVENDIVEEIDVTFAPPSQIPVNLKVVTKDEGDDAEIPDPPEPIENGMVDIGRLAAEYLLLGIDPYPRKPGAVFEAPKEPVDPQEHPFAALGALKAAVTQPKAKKPKDD